jgi:NADH-quinone oxidoreductase subunit E
MDTVAENSKNSGQMSRISHDVWLYNGEPGQLIPLLQAAQETYGYISDTAVKYISEVTGATESEIYGVVTFYKQFRLRPLGKYLIRLCDGTACHVNNAKMLRAVVEDELKLETEDTTEDGLFTLQPVACLGCCSLAPAMMINDSTYGRQTPQTIRQILRSYRNKEKNQASAAGNTKEEGAA